MRRMLFVLATGLVLATGAAAQENATATIWFYRSLINANEQPAYVYWINMPTRMIATLKNGEFFGLPVQPGTYSFAYVHAPARGQSVLVAVKAGEHAYVEVTPKSIENVGQIDKSHSGESRPTAGLPPLGGSGAKPADSMKKP